MALNPKLLSKIKGKMPGAKKPEDGGDEKDPMFDMDSDDADTGAGGDADEHDAGEPAGDEPAAGAGAAKVHEKMLAQVPTSELEKELAKRKASDHDDGDGDEQPAEDFPA